MKIGIHFIVGLLSLFLTIEASSQNIHQLVEDVNIAELKIMIRENPGQINATNQQGRTPLMHAAQSKNLEVMDLLLNEGADVKPEDNWGYDALNIAASGGFLKGVKRLIQADANINSQNRWQIAPLHYGINSHNEKLTKFLLENGADPNQVSHWGTPVQIAVKKENLDILQMLFQFGANPNVSNSVENTGTHTAVYANNPEILEFLIKKGAELNQPNALGYLPIHIASICGYTNMLRILEEHGALLNKKQYKGKRPEFLARYYYHPELLQYFEKTGLVQEGSIMDPDKDELNRNVDSGEAKIFYLGHSGWAVETRYNYLVFDYYPYLDQPAHPSLYNGSINLDELTDKPLMVFVSHKHRDHYNPVIYEWSKKRDDITYIFGWEAHNEEPYICFTDPYLEKNIKRVTVRNVFCDDGGSAFLIHTDGLSIYHSGDYTGDMEKDMKYLSSFQSRVDIAFVGMGYRVVSNYTLDRLNPVVAFPMHQRLAEYKYHLFNKEVSPIHPGIQIIPVRNKGDRYFYPSMNKND